MGTRKTINRSSGNGGVKVTPLRIFVVEDDETLRNLYVDAMKNAPDVHCVGAFGSVEEVMPVLDDELPNVILMDIGLPGMSGIEGVRKIKMLHPTIDILMLTVFDEEEMIFESICAGASGYILKNVRTVELIKSIKEIQKGAPMSPMIARRVLEMLRGRRPVPRNDFQLTSRETDILQWLVKGMSFKQIGLELFISPLTVHSHIKRIYEKLHVHSKSEAVATVMKNRIF